jgi:hypothetical protein
MSHAEQGQLHSYYGLSSTGSQRDDGYRESPPLTPRNGSGLSDLDDDTGDRAYDTTATGRTDTLPS